MATSEQLISLVKSFYENDNERFKTLVLQIAAHESKIGHVVLARQLKDIVMTKKNNSFNRLRMSENNLTIMQYPKIRFLDLIVAEGLMKKINRVLNEYKNRSQLRKSGYENRRKILLEGNSGTGKTFTASLIASELNLPLFTIQSDKLVTKYMGETSVKLRLIFDDIMQEQGVYFFDEFDTIGSDRGADNDVKEMHRVLNSFLQFLEQDASDSIIIAATNNNKLLDQALFRRFDDVLHYEKPGEDEIDKLFKLKLNGYVKLSLINNELIKLALGLCHADIVRACEDAIKEAIMKNEKKINISDLKQMIIERKVIYKI